MWRLLCVTLGLAGTCSMAALADMPETEATVEEAAEEAVPPRRPSIKHAARVAAKLRGCRGTMKSADLP